MRRVPCAKMAFLLVGLTAVLPAQSRKPTAKGGKPPVVEKVVDDKITRKDPAILAIDKFIKKKVRRKRADWKTAMRPPPELEFTAGRSYFWHVETDKGAMKIELFPDAAPRHVASTIYLSRAGFYDGLRFPRIILRFMAQGGSPLNTTAGNAGYTLDHEFAEGRVHDAPGILSAANSYSPNTDGSQFFLTFVPCPNLDGKHTVYGRVVEGLETLKKIEACGVDGARDGEKLAVEPEILRTWITVAAKAAKAGERRKDTPEKG